MIHVFDAGDGTPVLFLHAFPLDASMWRSQRGAWRTIAPSAAGFGESDPIDGDTLTMDAIADEAAAVLDAKKIDRAVVVGLSMGGYAALAFWRRHSKRVRALVLADTRAGADSPEGKAGRVATAKKANEKGASAIADELLSKLVARDESRPVVRSIIEAQRASAIAAAALGLGARIDSTATLATIDVPVLAIVGEKDVITPVKEAEAIVAGVKNGKLIEIPGAGHLSNIDDPDTFNTALASFLASL